MNSSSSLRFVIIFTVFFVLSMMLLLLPVVVSAFGGESPFEDTDDDDRPRTSFDDPSPLADSSGTALTEQPEEEDSSSVPFEVVPPDHDPDQGENDDVARQQRAEDLMLLWYAPFLGNSGYGSEALEFASSITRQVIPPFNLSAEELPEQQPKMDDFAANFSLRLRAMEKWVDGEDEEAAAAAAENITGSSTGARKFRLGAFGCFHHGDTSKRQVPEYHTEEFQACSRVGSALALAHPSHPHLWPSLAGSFSEEDSHNEVTGATGGVSGKDPRGAVVAGKRKSATESAMVHPSRIIAVCHSNQGMMSLPRPDFPSVTCPPRSMPVRATVARTMFESDRLPLTWRRRLLQLDEVWVPTEFHRRAFSRPDWPGSIPYEKMRVVPEPIDTELWRVDDQSSAVQFTVPFGFENLRVPTRDRVTRNRIAGISALSRSDLTPVNWSDPLYFQPMDVEMLRAHQNLDPLEDEDADERSRPPAYSRDVMLKRLKSFRIGPDRAVFAGGELCFHSRVFLSTFKRERRKGWDVLIRAVLEAFPARAVAEPKRTLTDSEKNRNGKHPICVILHTNEFAEEVPLDFPETIQLFVEFVYAKEEQVHDLIEKQERLQRHETAKVKRDFEHRMLKHQQWKAAQPNLDRFMGKNVDDEQRALQQTPQKMTEDEKRAHQERVQFEKDRDAVMKDFPQEEVELWRKYDFFMMNPGQPWPQELMDIEKTKKVMALMAEVKRRVRAIRLEREEREKSKQIEAAQQQRRLLLEQQQRQQKRDGDSSSPTTVVLDAGSVVKTIPRPKSSDSYEIEPVMHRLADRESAAKMALHQRAEMEREIAERPESYRDLCRDMCRGSEECALCERIVVGRQEGGVEGGKRRPPVFSVRDQVEAFRAFMRLRIASKNTPLFLFSDDGAQLSFENYKKLIAVSDVTVLTTRGEGWGRPVQEAMSMGIPSIVTNWSGPAAFSRPEFAFLIPIDEETQLREVPSDLWFSGGHRWAEPSVDDVRKLLLQALRASREKLDLMGARARQFVVKYLDVSVVGKIVANAVEELAERTGTKHL